MFENNPITPLFLITICLGILTPGPDLLYVLSVSLGKGRLASFMGTLGICSGLIIHMILTSAGLVVLIGASKYGFAAIKIAGAVYLIYLGIKELLTRSTFDLKAEGGQVNLKQVYTTGFLVNLLNPKFILFNIMFLPMFIDLNKGPVWRQMLILAGTDMIFAFVIFCIIGYFSAAMGSILRTKPKIMWAISWLLGILFIGLGLELFIMLFTEHKIQ